MCTRGAASRRKGAGQQLTGARADDEPSEWEGEEECDSFDAALVVATDMVRVRENGALAAVREAALLSTGVPLTVSLRQPDATERSATLLVKARECALAVSGLPDYRVRDGLQADTELAASGGGSQQPAASEQAASSGSSQQPPALRGRGAGRGRGRPSKKQRLESRKHCPGVATFLSRSCPLLILKVEPAELPSYGRCGLGVQSDDDSLSPDAKRAGIILATMLDLEGLAALAGSCIEEAARTAAGGTGPRAPWLHTAARAAWEALPSVPAALGEITTLPSSTGALAPPTGSRHAAKREGAPVLRSLGMPLASLLHCEHALAAMARFDVTDGGRVASALAPSAARDGLLKALFGKLDAAGLGLPHDIYDVYFEAIGTPQFGPRLANLVYSTASLHQVLIDLGAGGADAGKAALGARLAPFCHVGALCLRKESGEVAEERFTHLLWSIAPKIDDTKAVVWERTLIMLAIYSDLADDEDEGRLLIDALVAVETTWVYSASARSGTDRDQLRRFGYHAVDHGNAGAWIKNQADAHAVAASDIRVLDRFSLLSDADDEGSRIAKRLNVSSSLLSILLAPSAALALSACRLDVAVINNATSASWFRSHDVSASCVFRLLQTPAQPPQLAELEAEASAAPATPGLDAAAKKALTAMGKQMEHKVATHDVFALHCASGHVVAIGATRTGDSRPGSGQRVAKGYTGHSTAARKRAAEQGLRCQRVGLIRGLHLAYWIGGRSYERYVGVAGMPQGTTHTWAAAVCARASVSRLGESRSRREAAVALAAPANAAATTDGRLMALTDALPLLTVEKGNTKRDDIAGLQTITGFVGLPIFAVAGADLVSPHAPVLAALQKDGLLQPLLEHADETTTRLVSAVPTASD